MTGFTGFLEKWANAGKSREPSKPPVLPEAADSEPIEVGSHGTNPAAGSPEIQQPAEEELANAAANGADTPAASLKGQAVELWRDGRRFFLVADDEDALEAMRRFGAHLGEVWTSGELELVASIADQATRDEVEAFKRKLETAAFPRAGLGNMSPPQSGKARCSTRCSRSKA